jgi:hypothetical protein
VYLSLPARPGRRDHPLQRADTVGEVGVRVQVAAQVLRPNEGGFPLPLALVTVIVAWARRD